MIKLDCCSQDLEHVELTEFQIQNDGDNLLPIFLNNNRLHIISQKKIFYSLIGFVGLSIIIISFFNFSQNKFITGSLLKSQIDDDFFNKN
jgi:hypothetical protein